MLRVFFQSELSSLACNIFFWGGEHKVFGSFFVFLCGKCVSNFVQAKPKKRRTRKLRDLEQAGISSVLLEVALFSE